MQRSGFEILKNLIIKAGTELPNPVIDLIELAKENETEKKAKDRLQILIENAKIAKEEKRPICQDTGVLSVYLFLPEGAKLPLFFKETCDAAVEEAYKEAGFRFSTVSFPIGQRKNPGTNRPAFIKVIDAGQKDSVRIVVMPKGAGSENSSFIKMYLPTINESDLLRDLSEEIAKRAASSCPPVIAGVSIGGTFEGAALNAKLALLDAGLFKTDFGETLKNLVNEASIGPFGLGGKTTALDVQVRFEPAHIASLPVAVAMSCHALRYAEVTFSLEEWEEITFGV